MSRDIRLVVYEIFSKYWNCDLEFTCSNCTKSRKHHTSRNPNYEKSRRNERHDEHLKRNFFYLCKFTFLWLLLDQLIYYRHLFFLYLSVLFFWKFVTKKKKKNYAFWSYYCLVPSIRRRSLTIAQHRSNSYEKSR